MMKKLMSLMVALALFVSAPVFAAATKARTSSQGNGIMTIAGIGDLSTGNTADVTANGDLIVRARNKTEASVSSRNGVAQLVVTGPVTLHSILLTGGKAGDEVGIFNSDTVTNPNPVFEVEIGTANSTIYIPFSGGITFDTEIEVKFFGALGDDIVTFTYDTDTV